MKNIIFAGTIVLLAMFAWNCNKQVEEVKPETEFTEIAIPNNFKSNLKSVGNTKLYEDAITIVTKDGKEVYGKVRFTFPENNNDCSVVKIELSDNIFNETGLSTDFFKSYYSLKSTNDVAECFGHCEDRKHPGWCKAACFIVALVEAAASAL